MGSIANCWWRWDKRGQVDICDVTVNLYQTVGSIESFQKCDLCIA